MPVVYYLWDIGRDLFPSQPAVPMLSHDGREHWVSCRAADVSFLVRLADHVDRIDTVVEILATP